MLHVRHVASAGHPHSQHVPFTLPGADRLKHRLAIAFARTASLLLPMKRVLLLLQVDRVAWKLGQPATSF